MEGEREERSCTEVSSVHGTAPFAVSHCDVEDGVGVSM